MRAQAFATLVLAALWMDAVAAEKSPYSGLESRKIKALSEQQIKGYLGGNGMGLALSGELNGYPGPKHVIEIAEQLDLTTTQHEVVVQIFEAMKAQAILIGKRIVEAEENLDFLFASGKVESESLKVSTNEIGQLQGKLRAIHLQAHLDTKNLLSAHQVHKYVQLRGYAGNGHSGMEHHGHDY